MINSGEMFGYEVGQALLQWRANAIYRLGFPMNDVITMITHQSLITHNARGRADILCTHILLSACPGSVRHAVTDHTRHNTDNRDFPDNLGAALQLFECRNSIVFIHLKLALLTQLPASNE